MKLMWHKLPSSYNWVKSKARRAEFNTLRPLNLISRFRLDKEIRNRRIQNEQTEIGT